MYFSISSFLISFLIFIILVGLLQILLSFPKNYKWFRVDILQVIVYVALIRLFVPVEFFFSYTIPSKWMKNFNDLLSMYLWDYTLQQWLICAWVIGSFVALIRYLIHIVRSYRLIQSIKNTGIKVPIKNVSKPKYYYRTNAIDAPLVAFQNTILWPDWLPFKNEMLEHELQHINHHDFWLKQSINLLEIIYWWCPLVYLFKRQIVLFTEIRTDNAVTEKWDANQCLEYSQNLVEIQKHLIKQPSFPSSCFVTESSKILGYRIQYLLEGIHHRHSKKPVLILLCCIPLLSSLIIFEPIPEQIPSSISKAKSMSNESACLKKIEDKYHLIIDDENMGTVISPSEYDLPICP